MRILKSNAVRILSGLAIVAIAVGAFATLARGGGDTSISEAEARQAIRALVGHEVALTSDGTVDGEPNKHLAFRAPGYAFEVDGRTGEVMLAHLRTADTGGGVSVDVARTAAADFAGRAFRGFDSLTLTEDGVRVDHGASVPPTFIFTWREKVGAAITPTMAQVTVNAASGEVMSYVARRIPVKVQSLNPAVSEAQAVAHAVETAGGYSPPSKSATLEVWHDPESDGQRLVWRVRLTGGLRSAIPGVPPEKVGLPGNYEALVDAHTGAVVSQASG